MKLFKKKAEKNPEPIPTPKSQYQVIQEKVAGPFPEELLVMKRFGASMLLDARVEYSVTEDFNEHMVPCVGDTKTRIAVYKLVRVDEYTRQTVKVTPNAEV